MIEQSRGRCSFPAAGEAENWPAPIMTADLQTPFDVAIVMTTVVRSAIQQAIRSVFAQQYGLHAKRSRLRIV